jgi:hypothetical protein
VAGNRRESIPGYVMVLEFPGIVDFSQGQAGGILKIRKQWQRGTIYPIEEDVRGLFAPNHSTTRLPLTLGIRLCSRAD